MARKKPQKIFVVETNRMYDSIAEAARALGVDPSNARKAALGKRPSVGGYHLAAVTNAAEITAARDRVEALPADRERDKIERARKRKLVEAVHDIMIDVNKRARNAKREKVEDPILQRLLEHADYYGSNKTGGYQTSRQHLRQLSAEELENFVELTEKTKREYADYLYNPESASRNLASIAAQFGTNEEQMKKYWHIIPAIFEMFRQANVAEWKYNDIAAEIYDAVQADADPDDLRDYVIDLTNYYRGNRKEDLDAILEKWSTTRSTWSADWEEVEDE